MRHIGEAWHHPQWNNKFMNSKTIQIKAVGDTAFSVGAGSPLVVFCGPCVIESEESALEHAGRIQEIVSRLGLPFVYKSSYDKANRTSRASFRGVGIGRGLEILAKVREKYRVPVITDVHSPEEVIQAAEVVDVLQIPAFLCRQTDLLVAAGETGKPIMVKKGQFMHPEDMRYAAEKVNSGGNPRTLLCERGTCFGYRELVVDYRSLEMLNAIGCPVVFDATHSVQLMGGAGGKSAGNREYIPALARAAAAVGIDGIFLESHKSPSDALSDGPNMLPLEELAPVLSDIKLLHELKLEARVR